LLLLLASQPWQTQIDANFFGLPCMMSDLSGRTARGPEQEQRLCRPVSARNGHLERGLSWRSVQFAA
jgi:hypothetical protein